MFAPVHSFTLSCCRCCCSSFSFASDRLLTSLRSQSSANAVCPGSALNGQGQPGKGCAAHAYLLLAAVPSGQLGVGLMAGRRAPSSASPPPPPPAAFEQARFPGSRASQAQLAPGCALGH